MAGLGEILGGSGKGVKEVADAIKTIGEFQKTFDALEESVSASMKSLSSVVSQCESAISKLTKSIFGLKDVLDGNRVKSPIGNSAADTTAQATKASAIMQAVTAVTGALTSTFYKLRSEVLETVGAFRPFAVVQFNRAMMDLNAVLGQVFLPILNEMTAAVREVANWLYSMPDSFKDALRMLVKFAIVGGGLVIVLTALAAVMSPLVVIAVALGGALTLLKSGIQRFLSFLGIKLPEPKKDAFGMGHSGASVSDPMSVYNKISEELMRNARDEKPENKTAKFTEKISNAVDSIVAHIKGRAGAKNENPSFVSADFAQMTP